MLAPTIVVLGDAAALDPALTGAKAANLARARAAGLPVLPGVVLTTAWSPADRGAAVRAWRSVSNNGAARVVVRSSSTGEDGSTSSMAGVFESVLDVADERGFLAALATVIESADRARAAGLVDASMAVLVQPMLDAHWGGVLFGADPVSGRLDRFLVAAVNGGPDALVSGTVAGWTAVLDRRGRVREVRSGGTAPSRRRPSGSAPRQPAARPPVDVLGRLAGLARDAAQTYGGPQDIEWAVGVDGLLYLLQARPITTLGPRSGIVFGAGPVAESFPEPLAALEQDLWLTPLRDGLREALRLTASMPARALERTPLVIAVDGMAAVDLAALGAVPAPGGLLRQLDPRPPMRRLRAAWRVGRLRSAFAELAADIVRRVDADLLTVPALGELANHELIAVLRNARRSLVSLHGYEAIAGLLIPGSSAARVTGASLALSAIAQTPAEDVSLDELIEREPVVLALMPPRVGPPQLDRLGAVVSAVHRHGTVVAQRASSPGLAGDPRPGSGEHSDPDPAAVAREALRLRVRWLQELTARAAWELAGRLLTAGVLPNADTVRKLSLDELALAAQQRTVPADLADRREPTGQPLPARFRLDEHGAAWLALPAPGRRRRRAAVSATIGVSAGSATGPVVVRDGSRDGSADGDIPPGAVLVVSHLDPRLAPVIPRLGALIAETGSALSHLAILAREYRVPAVVGLEQATSRFRAGQLVTVDGSAGTVDVVERGTSEDGKPADGKAADIVTIRAAA